MSDDAGAQREELWHAYVYDHLPRSKPEDLGKRLADGLDVIMMCRHLAKEAMLAGDPDHAMKAAGWAQKVWRLISEEGISWTLTAFFGEAFSPEQQKSRLSERDQLRACLEFFSLSPPSHGAAFSVVAPVLPYSVAEKLAIALDALDAGEVQDIVAPIGTRRKARAWTHDEAKLRAIQRVAYLRGKGTKKMKARGLVAAALDVSSGTLKSWEERDLVKTMDVDRVRAAIELAECAGHLSEFISRDPEYGKSDGNHIDSHELALVEEFEDETLKDFGNRFEALFGKSYRS